jgi:hypothetical protein
MSHRSILAAAFLTLFTAACSKFNPQQSESKPEPEQVVVTPNEEHRQGPVPDPPRAKPSSEVKWAGIGETARLGPVSVRLARAAIEKPTILDGIHSDRIKFPKDLVVIALVVTNLSDSAKINYRDWDSDLSLGHDVAVLKDEFGNIYKRISWGLGRRLDGHVGDRSVYPGKSIDEAIAFELPVDKATRLFLELPGKNCEANGIFRFAFAVEQLRPGEFRRYAPPVTDKRFELEAWVKADGQAVRIWLCNDADQGDQANRIEEMEGSAKADQYARDTGGLRWVRRGEIGQVTITESGSHSCVGFDTADGRKSGWVSNAYLLPSARPPTPRPPPVALTRPRDESPPAEGPKRSPAPKPNGPSAAEVLAAKKANYVLIVATIERIESQAVAKFGKNDSIPGRAFIDRETPKALDALAKDLATTRGELQLLRKEGDAEGWPRK